MTDNLYASPEEMSDALPGPNRSKFTLVKLLLGLTILVVLLGLLLPSGRYAPKAVRRTQCYSNLKQICLALHNYLDDYGALPPAYTIDSNGRPLHSWRTLILPYLDQKALYNSIDLSKPWNDPVNASAFKTVPRGYCCPGANVSLGFTTYLGVAGTDCCFSPTTSRRFNEITDGTSETLMVVEAAAENAVPWMAPQDADQQVALSFTKGGKLAHTDGTQVALADGSVRFVSQDTDLLTLRALVTIAGGEEVGEF